MCPACDRANVHPLTGIYQAGCLDCEARSLAQSPQAHSRAADPGALQAAMRLCWPEVEKYKRGRAAVWAWIQKLEAGRGG
jgi:hypothetical protein